MIAIYIHAAVEGAVQRLVMGMVELRTEVMRVQQTKIGDRSLLFLIRSRLTCEGIT